MEDKKTFLNIVEMTPSPSGLTKRWSVHNKITDARIGQISWYAGWRRYAFWPSEMTVFDFGCLNQIAEFIEREMTERKS
jgi:hypothetical protein